MKKQLRREGLDEHVSFQDLRFEESVENCKRRHMLFLVDGDHKFFDRILAVKKVEEVDFVSRSSARNR